MKSILSLAIPALALGLAPAAFADHHEAAQPAADDCAALHATLMARHEAGETEEDIMASLDEETRAQADACKAEMDGHHGEGESHAEMEAEVEVEAEVGMDDAGDADHGDDH
ncbi:hypothetical protein [Maricaulis sp. CAU 1757]